MKKHIAVTLTLILSLPLSGLSVSTQTQTLNDVRKNQLTTKPSKLAPDLEEMLAHDDQQALTLSQMRQNRLGIKARKTSSATRLNGVTLPSEDVPAEEKQSFIVQINNTTPEIVFQEKLALLSGRINQRMTREGLLVIEAPRAAIRHIAADNNIAYVSPDRAVAASGHLETTTGIAQSRMLLQGTKLDGTGVGIAVLDSGTDNKQELLLTTEGTLPHKGVVYQKDFTGLGFNGDPYGHGSHVAALATGSQRARLGHYGGIAPNASVISLRVLDGYGRGTTSGVITALNWCITNRVTYNIRVINLSLGTHAKDSYKTDPLCLAARQAVNAGIVVVAAAGNDGKDSNGNKVYGRIHSPGIDPSVITVGAANTFGTDARSDDKITTYSSRGPTRGYTTDANGVRRYDNLIKPDLVAPGNKLISSCASVSSTQANYLARTYPELWTRPTDVTPAWVMYQSGTSMATPLVAGAAALLLQANPTLTPNLVKAILMYSAQPIKGANTLEQGAGLLNIDGAIRITLLVKKILPTTNGTALLSAALPSTQSSTIAGQTCYWGKGVITNYGFLYGDNLMNLWQGMYGVGIILGDGTSFANGTLTRSSSLTSGTMNLFSGAITSNGIILGDGIVFADGQILGDGTRLAQGIILGDGVVFSDGQILGDGIILGDGKVGATSVTILGDNTACMLPAA
jgi:serine protease AprX